MMFVSIVLFILSIIIGALVAQVRILDLEVTNLNVTQSAIREATVEEFASMHLRIDKLSLNQNRIQEAMVSELAKTITQLREKS